MEYLNTAQELLDFIMRCKSPFHVVKEASDLLNENGYTKLEETKEWSLVPGGKYYVTRNESSVIAFQIPESAFSSYQIIASHSDCPTFKVKGEDPFVTDGHYTRLNVEGSIWGASKEFLSSGRLDDLQSAFGSLKGFLAAKATGQVNVCAIFDNEEVGSLTKQGADSSFLTETLQHINAACGKDTIAYHRDLAGSFMVSADNAHAFHPAHAEKYDPKSRVYMNGGVVIKQSANQKYTTDAVSEAVTKMICEKAGVPCQVFANHADIPGGSTLGAILNSLVSVTSVDIGMAQLAMHSPYETAGAKDTAYLVQFAKTFYETTLVRTEHGFFLEEK